MSTAAISDSADATKSRVSPTTTKNKKEPETRGSWFRFFAMLVITAVVLIPLLAVVLLSLRPALGSTTTANFTLENFVRHISRMVLNTTSR